MINHPHADLLQRCHLERIGSTLILESDRDTVQTLCLTVDLLLHIIQKFRAERVTLLTNGKLVDSLTPQTLQQRQKKRLQAVAAALRSVSQ